jgi:hypothetical protein
MTSVQVGSEAAQRDAGADVLLDWFGTGRGPRAIEELLTKFDDRPSQLLLDRLRSRGIVDGRGTPPVLASASARAPEEEEIV